MDIFDFKDIRIDFRDENLNAYDKQLKNEFDKLFKTNSFHYTYEDKDAYKIYISPKICVYRVRYNILIDDNFSLSNYFPSFYAYKAPLQLSPKELEQMIDFDKKDKDIVEAIQKIYGTNNQI